MKSICIVGCGNIARTHVTNLRKRAKLFFQSRTLDKAQAFNRKYSGSGVFETFEQVVGDPRIDALILCSPPAVHCDQILQALKGGKSLLVEKPMVLSEEELKRVSRTVEETKPAVFMVAENYYYKPAFKKLRALIEEGAVGNLVEVSLHKVLKENPTNWKKDLGSLIEGGIHFVSLACGLVAEQPISVEAAFPTLASGKSETHAVLVITFKGGVKATVQYGIDTFALCQGVFQNSRIVGERGVITFESNGLYGYLSADKKRLFFPGLSDLTGHKAMIDDFLNCLENKSEHPFSDLQKAERDLRVIFQAYKKRVNHL